MKPVLGVLALAAAVCVFANCAQAQVSWKELNDLDALRTGTQPPFGGFDAVEAQAQVLLQKYKDPESQGRIYWAMAGIYGASGPGAANANKVIEYAQKALAFPLEPQMELQMYIYWGDSVQTAHAGVTGDQLVVVRREAVMPYLQGLKAALKYNLPDDPPDFPAIDDFVIVRGPLRAAENERNMRRNAEQARALEEVRRTREYVRMRESLIGQVVMVYSRRPFATDEIRALATQVIADDHSVARLMAAVEDAVNERITTGGPETPYMRKIWPKFESAPRPPPSGAPSEPAPAVTPQPTTPK